MNLSLSQNRTHVIKEEFPRLAYLISDVIVFLETVDFTRIQDYLAKFEKFVSATQKGVLSASTPSLLIIQNKVDPQAVNNRLSVNEATEDFFNLAFPYCKDKTISRKASTPDAADDKRDFIENTSNSAENSPGEEVRQNNLDVVHSLSLDSKKDKKKISSTDSELHKRKRASTDSGKDRKLGQSAGQALLQPEDSFHSINQIPNRLKKKKSASSSSKDIQKHRNRQPIQKGSNRSIDHSFVLEKEASPVQFEKKHKRSQSSVADNQLLPSGNAPHPDDTLKHLIDTDNLPQGRKRSNTTDIKPASTANQRYTSPNLGTGSAITFLQDEQAKNVKEKEKKSSSLLSFRKKRKIKPEEIKSLEKEELVIEINENGQDQSPVEEKTNSDKKDKKKTGFTKRFLSGSGNHKNPKEVNKKSTPSSNQEQELNLNHLAAVPVQKARTIIQEVQNKGGVGGALKSGVGAGVEIIKGRVAGGSNMDILGGSSSELTEEERIKEAHKKRKEFLNSFQTIRCVRIPNYRYVGTIEPYLKTFRDEVKKLVNEQAKKKLKLGTNYTESIWLEIVKEVVQSCTTLSGNNSNSDSNTLEIRMAQIVGKVLQPTKSEELTVSLFGFFNLLLGNNHSKEHFIKTRQTTEDYLSLIVANQLRKTGTKVESSKILMNQSSAHPFNELCNRTFNLCENVVSTLLPCEYKLNKKEQCTQLQKDHGDLHRFTGGKKKSGTLQFTELPGYTKEERQNKFIRKVYKYLRYFHRDVNKSIIDRINKLRKITKPDIMKSKMMNTQFHDCLLCFKNPHDTLLQCRHSFCKYCMKEVEDINLKNLQSSMSPSTSFLQMDPLPASGSKEQIDCNSQHSSPRGLLEPLLCPLCDLPLKPLSDSYVIPGRAGYRILSLDGGGIKGIVELTILERILRNLPG